MVPQSGRITSDARHHSLTPHLLLLSANRWNDPPGSLPDPLGLQRGLVRRGSRPLHQPSSAGRQPPACRRCRHRDDIERRPHPQRAEFSNPGKLRLHAFPVPPRSMRRSCSIGVKVVRLGSCYFTFQVKASRSFQVEICCSFTVFELDALPLALVCYQQGHWCLPFGATLAVDEWISFQELI